MIYGWRRVLLGVVALPFVPLMLLAVCVGGLSLLLWQLFGILGDAVEEAREDTAEWLARK